MSHQTTKIVAALAAIVVSLIPLTTLAQEQREQDFNIAAVGDWGCTENTDAAVQNIFSRNPELDADTSLTIFDGALDPGTYTLAFVTTMNDDTAYMAFYGAMDDNYQTHLPTLERMTESVGMSNAISDEAAIKFAASFYRPLGFGQSVNSAFLFGCNDIGLQNIPEEATPKLKYAPGVDPAKVYLTKT